MPASMTMQIRQTLLLLAAGSATLPLMAQAGTMLPEVRVVAPAMRPPATRVTEDIEALPASVTVIDKA